MPREKEGPGAAAVGTAQAHDGLRGWGSGLGVSPLAVLVVILGVERGEKYVGGPGVRHRSNRAR